jgi:hypothetical protein
MSSFIVLNQWLDFLIFRPASPVTAMPAKVCMLNLSLYSGIGSIHDCTRTEMNSFPKLADMECRNAKVKSISLVDVGLFLILWKIPVFRYWHTSACLLSSQYNHNFSLLPLYIIDYFLGLQGFKPKYVQNHLFVLKTD